ncbi:N-acetyl-gamma-glutamyl-phosphate reductase [Thiospirillum jenense]|uniref:N-acetyl-gamma-glutamyl-phosphate reductase n=1 Tax=Thiospirillum jenense TaxID=1653858 RepID=A0A839HE81_9GAMM|nr:N-acetyl-gamma-glutamyl-phosphate reductase [Thiospirillum jenense]MBB1127245.1 N-acetyl-gamma-glutamyl-phosphate reductase [Thiospirillum jenense]
MIRVAVVGATGYTGSELLRLLVVHPHVELAAVTSRTEAGVAVATMFPQLRGHCSLAFCAPDLGQLGECDLVFFATPNGTAMTQVPALLQRGARVIDLAADFRLRDVAVWERWYGMTHACPELLAEAVYGLPELYREAVRTARIVANPGCYPTAVTLGFLPLLDAQVVDLTALIADVKSGASGAGRKASTNLLLAEAGESFKAYSVNGHRHQPEIVQTLAAVAGVQPTLTFVPHLVPMVRGIEATLYAPPVGDDALDLQAIFERRYQHEPFVDVMPPGSHPETRSVRGTNLCRLAVTVPSTSGVVVIQSVIDNLVKGAAGQAVQNMNLMFGYDETCGLCAVALAP